MLGDCSETRKNDFKIEYIVEEGMRKLRSLDRRPSSRIYRIGVNGEKNVLCHDRGSENSKFDFINCSLVKFHVLFKTNNEIQWFLYKIVI